MGKFVFGYAAALGLWLGLMGTAAAEGMRPEALPDPLRSWAAWVEGSRTDRGCERPGGECVWLGPLEVEIEGKRARWSMGYRNLATDARRIRLPGGAGNWPERARVGGIEAAVGEGDEGEPWALVPPGEGELSGELSADGGEIGADERTPFARIREGKRIRLESGERIRLSGGEERARGREPGEQKARIRIARLLEDGQAATLETRVEISAPGGGAGPVEIEGLLPEGARAYALESDAPARWDGKALRVEPRAGRGSARIKALVDRSLGKLGSEPKARGGEIEGEEAWAIRADLRIRGLEVRERALDPSALDLPEEWAGLPAYGVALGEGPEIREAPAQRGDGRPKVRTSTVAWVDFAGEGATLRQAARIESGPGAPTMESWGPWEWRQAREGGEAAYLARGEKGYLLALRPGSSEAEIVARGGLDGWRLELPAYLGREGKVEEAVFEARVPPGWRVLGVGGASAASRPGWTGAFTLWEWFALILCGWGSAKLLGWRAALAASAGLLAGRLFLGAPFGLLLALLPFPWALRALPEGRLRKGALALGWALFAALAAQLGGFTLDRAQKWMHPALEDRAQPGAGWGSAMAPAARLASSAGDAAREGLAGVASSPMEMDASARSKAGNASERKREIAEDSGGGAAQAGIGEPSWEWLSARAKARPGAEKVVFWLMPPWAAQPLGLAAAGLLWFWALSWAREMGRSLGKGERE